MAKKKVVRIEELPEVPETANENNSTELGKESPAISIERLVKKHVTWCIKGDTPIILNRMPNKVGGELLFPKGKKTQADKNTTLKHDPYVEFRESPYTFDDPNAPTLIAHISTALKKATAGAATDLPSLSKAAMNRLLSVDGQKIPVYGIPRLFMAVTRSADVNRTPDVRTRCIIEKWATIITLFYIHPILNERMIYNLVNTAGMIQGIGDWRQEKGSGSYGSFSIVDPDDKEFLDILKTGGRKAQLEAMRNPIPYDNDTRDLLNWFFEEAKIRGREVTNK